MKISDLKPRQNNVDIEGEVKSISTDGYRLSGWTEKVKSIKKSEKILIPSRFAKEVARIVERAKEEVSLYPLQEGKMLAIKQGSSEFFLRTIEGEFPNYHAIIPEGFSVEVFVETEPFLQALKTALVFSRDASNIIKIEIESGKLLVRATSASLGEHLSEIPVEMKKGEAGKIAFNGKYLVELLSNVKKEKLWFGMNEVLKPGMFRFDEEAQFFYLVMPFKVQET